MHENSIIAIVVGIIIFFMVIGAINYNNRQINLMHECIQKHTPAECAPLKG